MEISRFHNTFLWLDDSHFLTKEVMKRVTRLNDTSILPKEKDMKTKDVEDHTQDIHYGRSLVINVILDLIVRYVPHVIGKKVHYSNR